MNKTDNDNQLTRLYIVYHTSEYGGEAIDPNERWTSYEDAYRELSVKSIHKTEPKDRFFFDSIEVDKSVLSCKKVFLVVVRYSDGDTFGQTHGYHKFYSVRATAEETALDEASIKAPNTGKNYRSWDGYFSSLEGVEILNLPLLP